MGSGDRNHPGKGTVDARSPMASPKAAVAAARANFKGSTKGGAEANSIPIHTPPGSESGPPFAKSRRLGDPDVMDGELDSPEQVGPIPSIPTKVESMLATLMESMHENNLSLNSKLDTVSTNLVSFQQATDVKFDKVHSLISAQDIRITALVASAESPAGRDCSDSAFIDMKAKIDSLESLIKNLKVDQAAAPVARGWLPGASSSSSAGAPPPLQVGPASQQNSFKPNVVWIKGLKINVTNFISKSSRTGWSRSSRLASAPAPPRKSVASVSSSPSW